MGMFLSPVVYPASMLTERIAAKFGEPYTVLVWLNPVAGIIEACRASVVGRPIAWDAFGIAVAITVVLFVIGYVYFRKTERSFADII